MTSCAIIDANVFLGFLLFPNNQTAVVRVVRSAICGELTLVLPSGVVEEMQRKVREQPYFQQRITDDALESLIALIQEVALAPWERSTWPTRSDDPNDQYLLDAAAGNRVEFLITGDRGLLGTGRSAQSALIVTAAQFLSLMKSEQSS